MPAPVVHPTAIVDAAAILGDDVEVGPFVVLAAGVRVGPRTRIGAHSVVEGQTRIGPDCVIGPQVVLGSPPQLRGSQQPGGALEIGAGTCIREFATVHRGSAGSKTAIGAGNLLMAYAHVAHDCRLGDRNELANGAQLAGHVRLGDGVTVGGLAGIHQHVRVGDLALVAAGSMVSQDVPPYCCASGDRARVAGLNRVGLKRNEIAAETRALLARALRSLYAASTLREGVDAIAAAELDDHPLVARLVSFALSSDRGLCRGVRALAAREGSA